MTGAGKASAGRGARGLRSDECGVAELGVTEWTGGTLWVVRCALSGPVHVSGCSCMWRRLGCSGGPPTAPPAGTALLRRRHLGPVCG